MSNNFTGQREQLPQVAAIIVNWNSCADTLECLASLKQSTYTNLKVMVVDNASTDGSVSAVHSQFPNVTVIETGANLGYGRACNVGIANAMRDGAEFFFLLNADMKIDPPAIGELVALCAKDPAIGVAGPTEYFYATPDMIQQFGGVIELTRARVRDQYIYQTDHGQLPLTQEVTCIGGGVMFVRRQALEQAGGFDPIFFLYGEEVDLAIRIAQAGYKLVVTSRAKVWHKWYGASGGKPNAIVKYNYFRSWMILGRRYLRGADRVVFYFFYFIARLLRFVLGCLLRGNWGLIVPALRGACDGIREKRACQPAPERFTPHAKI